MAIGQLVLWRWCWVDEEPVMSGPPNVISDEPKVWLAYLSWTRSVGIGGTVQRDTTTSEQLSGRT